jgi:hypothetical protein
MIALLLTLLVGSSASAAEDSDLFHRFADQFVGSDWDYHTRMMSAAKDVTFDGSDIRSFRYGMRGNFLIADVYAEENGQRTHVAVELAGWDRQQERLQLAQYWPWQASRLGDVRAKLRVQSSGAIGLNATARPAGQDFPRLDIACEMLDADTYRCETQTTTKSGETFLSNVETSRRRATSTAVP